jgi:hypothetical protein
VWVDQTSTYCGEHLWAALKRSILGPGAIEIVAYQACSEHKIPLRHQWIVRVYLDDGHKVAECDVER